MGIRISPSALLSALVLLASLSSASHISYDGSAIHFGQSGELAVFSCPPSGCVKGFLNSSQEKFLAAARPVNDEQVEFRVLRAVGQPSSCVLRLVSPKPMLSGQPAQSGAARFVSGDFSFILAQAEVQGGGPFSVELGSGGLCIGMPENVSFIDFYLVPERGQAAGQNKSAGTNNASSAAPLHSLPNSPASYSQSQPPASSNAATPAPATLSSAPPQQAPARYASGEAFWAGFPSAPLAQPPALSLRPSAPYPALSALYALIMLLAGRIVRGRFHYAIITLLPLAVGLFTLPDDGFKPVGLALWAAAWIVISLRSKRLW